MRKLRIILHEEIKKAQQLNEIFKMIISKFPRLESLIISGKLKFGKEHDYEVTTFDLRSLENLTDLKLDMLESY